MHFAYLRDVPFSGESNRDPCCLPKVLTAVVSLRDMYWGVWVRAVGDIVSQISSCVERVTKIIEVGVMGWIFIGAYMPWAEFGPLLEL